MFKNIIYPLLKKNKRGFFVIFFFSILVSLGGAVQPYIMQHIIDNAILASNINQLIFLVSISFFLTVFVMIISYINEIYYTKNSMNILFEFRKIVFNKLFLHDKTFLNNYHSADLMSRVQGDISELQRFYTDSVFSLFSTIISLVFICFIVYSYNIKLMILILIFLPIEFFCLKPLYPHIQNSTKTMRESTSNIGKFFIENFRYMLTIKNLGAKEQVIDKLNFIQDDYKNIVIKNKKINLLFSQIPAFISLLGKTIIIAYGGYLTIKGELKIGELFAFLTYFTMILAPVHTILGVINNFPKVKVSLNRVLEILPKEKDDIELKTTNFDLVIKNLEFSYSNNKIFENLNLFIKERSKIAIIGKNGAGKTTFADLLCGFLKANNGDIFIGNEKIGENDYINFSSYLVKLEQTPIIFDDTLKNNLLLAKNSAKEEELIDCLKKTGMCKWFRNLQKGLNTNLLESGANLSGGQKQRLALSRLILLNPKIIILDEFTSSIDEKDTIWFYENISTIFRNSTIIAITHNLNMLSHFDKVYLLENKTLKEYKNV
ncbi:ABC transporter ATP-binding protein [Aliarcobacter butzleri]|uniref:ABC transporter ATP-binding protein n=1 Tax=Aliarcobacter butzleri TaxID=28197 RepID=UPI00125F945A|nr:ABC transporter ATP-binding protein [Aliarcobacter butzleri]MCT7594172.1 ABC transporter ATP-binding protein/permease [Aliarcobacter butzleri]MCT7599648.1 ABC transporter ATP-binding protein/permease [Aliarcobacter butzleri]MCT7651687.1 ABC transporter ATP-binding protein/permease [Aliarcobacter butzleri]MDN5044365.1 ABC transporter ATP-binding protein [Aliarcobacter butzleri]